MLIGLIGMGWAHESVPQEVLVSDSIPVFEEVERDSGWIPESGSLAIRLKVVADGGLDVEMPGDAHLVWPEDMNLGFEGTPGAGRAALRSEIFPEASLKFDVAGYNWEIDAPIELGTISFEVEEGFDPYLFGTELVIEETAETTLYETGFSVLSVVDLNFRAEMDPLATVRMAGVSWGAGEDLITQEGETIPFPPEEAASFDTTAVYQADIGMDIELEFIPVFEVCINYIVGQSCFDWDAGEFPVTSFSDSFIHTFPENPISFPIPWASVESDGNDFGEIGPGHVSNWQVPVSNDGELPLVVEASITGDTDAFTVFPGTAYATADLPDGVTVSFSPQTEGSFEATLELATNDPSQPLIRLPLQGSAAEGAGPASLGDSKLDSEPVGGCACSTGRTPQGGAALWIGGMALFFWRRRSLAGS